MVFYTFFENRIRILGKTKDEGDNMSYKVFICGVDTSKIPKLTTKETNELLSRIAKGDKEARDKFLYSNLRLVLSVIHRFNFNPCLTDDIFQVACLGLTKALNNFRFDLGVQFSTYAVPMIIGEIRRFLRENTTVKVSRSLRDIAYKVMSSKQKLQECSDYEPTLNEVAADTGISSTDISTALNAISDPISLYEPAYFDGEDSILVMDQISDGNKEDTLIENLDLKSALDMLSEKEREVIDLRYFKGKTQTETSKICAVSQAQISRIENSAIKRLRACMT